MLRFPAALFQISSRRQHHWFSVNPNVLAPNPSAVIRTGFTGGPAGQNANTAVNDVDLETASLEKNGKTTNRLLSLAQCWSSV